MAKAEKLPQPSTPQREDLGVNIMTIHRSKGLEKPIVFVAGLSREFNLVNTHAPVLFHQDLGLGPKRLHDTLRMQYPTLARHAISDRMVRELMEEELRLLYVAMTRAREKLILSVSLTGGMREVEGLQKDFTVPLHPMALREQASVGKWVLLYALGREDARMVLGAEDLTEPYFPCRSRWQVDVVDCTELAEDVTATLTMEWEDEATSKVEESTLERSLLPQGETDQETSLEETRNSTLEIQGIGAVSSSLEGSEVVEESMDLEDSPVTEACFTPEEWEEILQYRQQYLWVYPHIQEVEAPSKFTATQTKGKVLHLDEEGGIHVVEGEKSQEFSATPPLKNPFAYRKKPRVPEFTQKEKEMTAAQRGTAMHLVMQYMDIATLKGVSPEEIQEKMDALQQSGHLTAKQCLAVSPERIASFLSSPLGEKARRASRCHQEFKFSLLVEGNKLGVDTCEELLLQGVIDCWFQDEEGITIIDFKSDKVTKGELEAKTKEHGNQMAVYTMALQRILGEKVVHQILWFFDQDCGMECR